VHAVESIPVNSWFRPEVVELQAAPPADGATVWRLDRTRGRYLR
jgi:hypothetical protein